MSIVSIYSLSSLSLIFIKRIVTVRNFMLVFLELTELIARKVGVRPCKMMLEKFANNETNVQLLDQVRCQDVYIIQTGLHSLISFRK